MKKRARRPAPLLGDGYLAAIATALRPRRLSRERREAVRERILERVRGLPPPGTATASAIDMDWVEMVKGVRMKPMRQDKLRGDQTVLVEMLPGSEFPPHEHLLEEEFFVLDGECFLDGYRLRKGDLHTATAGSRHPRMTCPRGVLLLVRSEILGAAPAA